MFQIAVVEGEQVCTCNICKERFNQDAEITKHIAENHNEIIIKIANNLEENEEKNEGDNISMTTLSDSDQDKNDDSEDDAAFLARFNEKGQCIG